MAEEAVVDTQLIKEKLAAMKGGRFKAWLEICARCGYCSDSCFFYRANKKDPKYQPAYKVQKTLSRLYQTNGNLKRAELEAMAQIAWGDCSLCRRCSMFCPFGIDIAGMISGARAVLATQELMPDALKAAIQNHWKYASQMDITAEDLIETCEWMVEENEEEWPGLNIPIDKQGADMMYTINGREVKYYPQDIAEVAILFHMAKVDYTMPSYGFDCTNLAMFAGDIKCATHQVKAVYDAAEKLGVNKIGVTE